MRVANHDGLPSIASSSICHCILVADTEEAIAKVRALAPAVPVLTGTRLSKGAVLRVFGVNIYINAQLVIAFTESAQPHLYNAAHMLIGNPTVHRGRQP